MSDQEKRIAVADLVSALGVAFPNAKPPEKATLDVYWLGLQDLTVEAIKHAGVRALRECKFFPSIAELRQLAGAPTVEQRAVQAWAWLRGEFAQKCGRSPGHQVIVDDATLAAAVGFVGDLKHVLQCSDAELPFVRKDFLRAYALLDNDPPPRVLNIPGQLRIGQERELLFGATGFAWARSRQELQKLWPPQQLDRPRLRLKSIGNQN